MRVAMIGAGYVDLVSGACKANAHEAVTDANAGVIGDRARTLDLDHAKTSIKQPVMVDLRNIQHPEDMAHHGFKYSGIGRG